MQNGIIILILISSIMIGCNTTFLNHKDYKFKVKDFGWNIKIEGVNGEIYVKDSNFIFGRNWYSTFVVISSVSGAILDTLKPFTVEKERDCLINDDTGEYKSGYSLHNVPVDKQKYSEVTLKTIDRQYRGDSETYYLIVKTLSNKEFTILFNRGQFSSIEDILYLKDGKYVMKYNCEAGATTDDPFITHIGLFDLEKIIKNEYGLETDSKEVFRKSDNSIVQKPPIEEIKTIGTVKIGNQVWMAENLNVDRFRNGDLIPEAKTTEEWMASAGVHDYLVDGKPAWCYYESDTEKGKKYGKLYNWYAVNDKRGLTPEGWHIPTKAEFETLGKRVSSNSNELKEIGQGTGTNTSLFSALLAGYREPHGNFTVLGDCNGFWSSTGSYEVTNAWCVYWWGNDNSINLSSSTKEYGFSVRCLKNF